MNPTSAERVRHPRRFPPSFASAWGDDEFGLYCDVAVGTVAARVVQRFRWIEPGTFLMGSPESEPERFADEGPQHLVTLTRGFWLADTTCPQKMWQAVMGESPSRFAGDPQRPVEEVSWEQVRQFSSRASALVPGVTVDLPTEAEWEYACRAGTTGPFSFGEQISPEVVNYDGNRPYAGGRKGEFRQMTVAVKSLPANGWGLYEMHGNVWEWCKDGPRVYGHDAVVDPVGPDDTGARARRAVRGGSWLYHARGVRSACRHAHHPGNAFDYLGFRVCLRSIDPG